MGNLKLFVRNDKEIVERLMKVNMCNVDTRKKFLLDKFAKTAFVRCKLSQTTSTELYTDFRSKRRGWCTTCCYERK